MMPARAIALRNTFSGRRCRVMPSPSRPTKTNSRALPRLGRERARRLWAQHRRVRPSSCRGHRFGQPSRGGARGRRLLSKSPKLASSKTCIDGGRKQRTPTRRQRYQYRRHFMETQVIGSQAPRDTERPDVGDRVWSGPPSTSAGDVEGARQKATKVIDGFRREPLRALCCEEILYVRSAEQARRQFNRPRCDQSVWRSSSHHSGLREHQSELQLSAEAVGRRCRCRLALGPLRGQAFGAPPVFRRHPQGDVLWSLYERTDALYPAAVKVLAS